MSLKQPGPVLVRLEHGGWNLKYETVHEDSGEVISVTNLFGSLEDIISKVVAAHRNATFFAERLRSKLADLQVQLEKSRNK